jgi:pimeloyl-ACP methyl ester carboxylesterase
MLETYADDDLVQFEQHGAQPLPADTGHGYVRNEEARIWYGVFGSGPGSPVVMLHGGLGHSGNWGFQVPALLAAGYRTILIDTRGHGRSTRAARPFTYELLASDVLAVMDALHIERAPIVGWSDGACTALMVAMQAPERVTRVVFFGCSMDPSGTKNLRELPPIVQRCLRRHAADYARLSATPDRFDDFASAVQHMMATQPNCSPEMLARIHVPVKVVHSEHDEFIKLEHAEYLARSIPRASFVLLPDVSHFAPLQRPKLFNDALLAFLGETSGQESLE